MTTARIYGTALGEPARSSLVAYPDPAVETVDPRFAKYVVSNAAVERLFTGARWAEGPVWFADGRFLLFSDIPNNRILRWLEDTAEVISFYMAGILRAPLDDCSGMASGSLKRTSYSTRTAPLLLQRGYRRRHYATIVRSGQATIS